jgi:CheY-like chemotaxis protein
VDDEAEVRVTVGAFLRNAGYVMTNVTNGEDAVIKLPTGERFDLMITDDAMPGANGFAVLYPAHARIRKSLGEMIRKLSVTSSQ